MLLLVLLLYSLRVVSSDSDCSWLGEQALYSIPGTGKETWYHADCCTTQAVDYLNSNVDNWRNEQVYNERWKIFEDLRGRGMCDIEETTTRATTTTTIPTTTTVLKCGVLTNTTCCTLNITSCLTKKYGDNWLEKTDTAGYEEELAECGCVLETTSTTTEITTTSSISNCSWLSTPFELTTSWNPDVNSSYFGACCSETAMTALNKSSFSWMLYDNAKPDSFNKWQVLTTILYCTEGACTDPPLWTNCSVSSTSSSSSTSTQSTSTSAQSSSSTQTESTTSQSSTTVSTTTLPIEPIGNDNRNTTTSSSTTTEVTSTESTTVNGTSAETTTVTSTETTTANGTSTESTSTTPSTSISTGETSDSTTQTTPISSTVTTNSTSPANSTSSQATTSIVLTTNGTDSTTSISSTSSSTTVTSPSTLTTGTSTASSTASISGENTTTLSTSSTWTPTSTTTLSSGATTPSSTVTTTQTTTSVTKTVTTATTPPKTTTNVDGVYTVPTTEGTTTYNWPTGGTTRILPSGEIILSESLIAYSNCTTVLMQLIFNPSTNTTRTQIESDPEGCKTTSSSVSSTTPMTTPKPSTTPSTLKTTTFNWPTGGTTRVLPSGEIILSESLIAYSNCTTVLMQLIFNPSTNETRTETTTDAEGCKATSSTSSKSTTSRLSTTPMPTTKTTSKASTTSSTPKTTTYNWPTGGTTRVLPSGEIILSESLIAYKNCTTVLMQLIYNPSTNQTRTETTTDAEGCKATSTKGTTPMPSSTTPQPTTTFNWPTGGTTRTLPSGEIILSESLIAYQNCTTVLMQLIYNPSTNTTRTETTADAQGCKATTTTTAAPTTTYNWPTGGTTRLLPSGEIILSESLIAYKNCTTVLMQLIYNPSTNATRTETTSDAQGCVSAYQGCISIRVLQKATSTGTSPYSTTPMPSEATTTFEWPTGGTTRTLPSGEIILSESLIAYKNCTTVLMQLIYNPTTNTTRTETTSDAEGCKATSSTSTATTPLSTTTEPPFTFPESKTTQILPSGEIILSESLIAYQNCTTVLHQLIFNPTTNTTRTETTSDAQGCKATTTTKTSTMTPSSSTNCTALNLNLDNTIRPAFNEVKGSYAIGERVIHMCKKRYAFEIAQQPLKIYQCKSNGQWAGTPEKCICE
uniref:Sushi domain-containing protein n=1 Tax=Caenorhabditis tropicalis TaxID=1561998 RepID=A0A1I7T7T0_9PELO